MELISYRGEVAAVAGPSRVHLAPAYAGRPAGDPELRVVCFMCLYVRELLLGRLPGPYRDGDAERFARAALIGADDLAAAAGRPDEDLARELGVPADAIAAQRRDLAELPTP